jgi:nucleotide-binding universal stress UspA family protein
MDLAQPILVPYDDSPYARVAAAHARAIAAARGAPTTLLQVLPANLHGGARSGAEQRAHEVLGEQATLFGTPVSTRVAFGEPAATIAEVAVHAGLVVVGSRGRSVVAGLLLGSVTRFLLRSLPTPILVVHERPPPIGRVVVGVDDGESAPAVVGAAQALAEAMHAPLRMVFALDADPDVVVRPEAFGIPSGVWAEAVKARAEGVFGPVRALAPGATEQIAYGLPADCLRDAAKDADAVVVGRTGRSGRDVDAWLSVAFAVAIRGPFATLVI